MPIEPAMSAGTTKSNNWIVSKPISLAIPTTRRLVEVPMVVDMPPIKVAIPIGIRILEELISAFWATAMSAGINITTIGVLLIKALKKAPKRSTPSNESLGWLTQDLDKKPISGWREPLTSMAFPMARSKQIVISASLPKLVIKKTIGLIGLPLKLYGKIKNKLSIVTNISNPEVSIGIHSLENK